MEKDKKVKVILFAGLILFAVLAMLWEDPVSFEGQEEQYAIKKSEPKEEKERLDKRDIYKLKPKKEDNMQPIDGKESSELALQFTGYDAADPAYDWLQGEDWTRFKEAVAVYLEKKELKEVTTVHVQADSQQKISDYMRYSCKNMDRCLFQNTMNISVGLPMRGWICIINRKRYKKSSIRIMITLCLITVHIPSKDLIKRPF